MLLSLFVVPMIGSLAGYYLFGNWGAAICGSITALVWYCIFRIIVAISGFIEESRERAQRRLETKDADREEVLREVWGDEWEAHQ